MNAAEILAQVAETCAKLQSLAVEVVTANESLDGYSRSEQRVWCHFEAPDRVRIEHKGSNRMVTVRNGADQLTYFGVGNRVARHTVDARAPLPGEFAPDMPGVSDARFLFRRIADAVKAAEVVKELPGAVLIRVDYDARQHPFFSAGPVLFSIDTATKLVSRAEVEVSHHLHDRPPDGEVHSSRQVLVVRRAVVNEAIAPDTFVFVPPPDAEEMQPGIRGGGAGGRFSSHSGKGSGRISTNHDWDDGSLAERTRLVLQGIEVSIERRFKVSDNLQTVEISERFTSAAGEKETTVSLPLPAKR